MKEELKPNSKVKMAAATFSMFAFQELKDELEKIDELKFIFTNPTFTKEETKKQLREYRIPKKKREDSLFGASYELKLMNELKHREPAKECSNWIKNKVRFKSINLADEEISQGIRIETNEDVVAIDKLRNFDLKELGYEPSRFKSTRHVHYAPQSLAYLQEFDDYWSKDEYFREVTQEVIESLSVAY